MFPLTETLKYCIRNLLNVDAQEKKETKRTGSGRNTPIEIGERRGRGGGVEARRRQTDMFLFGVLYKESTLTTIPNS